MSFKNQSYETYQIELRSMGFVSLDDVEAVKRIHLPNPNLNDKLIWTPDKKWDFSIKSAYFLFLQSHS